MQKIKYTVVVLMKFIIRVLFLSVSFLFLLKADTTNTAVTLQLVWKNQFQFAGYYMAKEKGFYRDAGLDVNIKEFDNDIDITADVVDGKAEFGVGRSSLINDRYSGKPVVMLAAIFQHSPIILISKKRDDIAKIEDLKNKRIMLTTDQIAMASINAMLKSHEITPSLYITQEHSFNIEDLIDGKTDVMLSYISNEPYIMKERNIPYRVFAPKDYNFDFYSDILFTSDKLVQKKPLLVDNFREASLKGWKYALENKEETIKLILEKYNTQNKSQGSLKYEADAISKLIDMDRIKLGNIDKNRVEYIAQIYSLMGLNKEAKSKETKSIEGFIYEAKKNKTISGIELTQKEQDWLGSNPVVRVSSESDYIPYDFNEDGIAKGYSVDYMNLLFSKLGIEAKYVTDNWNNLLEKLKNKEIDIVHTMFKNNDKKEFIYSNPYKQVVIGLFTHKENNTLANTSDLTNERISIIEGDSIGIPLGKYHPNIRLSHTNTYLEALKEVSFGKSDASVMDTGVGNFIINKFSIPDLKLAAEFNAKDLGLDYSYHFAIHKDNAILVGILNKAMHSVKQDEIDILEKRWLRSDIEVDYSLVWKILAGVFLVILIFTLNNRKLKMLVNEKTEELQELLKSLEEKVQKRTQELNDQKEFVQTLLDSQEQIIVTTDGKSILDVNRSFLEFYEISSIEEFKQKYDAKCICDTFNTKAPEGFVQKLMGDERWVDYIIARKHSDETHKIMITRDGVNHIFSATATLLPGEKGIKSTIFTNITTLERVKQEIEQVLANILLPVVISSRENRKILYVNKAAEVQFEKSVEELIGSDIDDVYVVKGRDNTIIETIMKYGKVDNLEKPLVTATGKEFMGLVCVNPIKYKGVESFIAMVTDITKQKDMENEVRAINKHMRDSIEYAALIQGALIPDNQIFKNFFQDHFALWQPKDIVGGDIYLMNELSEDELILMVIDCTGHGVPGAFVTMLVKAIERQLMANIHKDQIISPAKILGVFNRSIKNLLKQESIDSISNAGFDGGIIYYNKKDKIIKFSGAETALFYMDESSKLQTIKGSRHSVGYKKSDINFEFKEHTIRVKEGMKFYCSTDGYFDQNGGDRGFPFGKKRFAEIIKDNHHQSMTTQQEMLLCKISEYESMIENNERNDDMTVVGFTI